MRKQYFVANNLWGEGPWKSVMSEGLLLNSKYIKIGRNEGVFKLFSHSHP